MVLFKGYKFTTEKAAIIARQKAAEYQKLPVNDNDVTKYWVDFMYSEIGKFWYIQHVEGLENVLGEPSDITITTNNEPI